LEINGCEAAKYSTVLISPIRLMLIANFSQIIKCGGLKAEVFDEPG
jgi:hypothetical protein